MAWLSFGPHYHTSKVTVFVLQSTLCALLEQTLAHSMPLSHPMTVPTPCLHVASTGSESEPRAMAGT